MASTTPPMPTPTVPNRSLTTFKTLSFDIFGTLINWEESIIQLLRPLLDALPSTSPYRAAATDRSARRAIIEQFKSHEHTNLSSHPGMLYSTLLTKTYLALAAALDLDTIHNPSLTSHAQTFGNSVGSWPAFPDTVDAMQRLSKYYRLIPLSNVDRASFTRTLEGPLAAVPFWRIYIAEDIGSYKPDLRNFEYLLRKIDEDDRSEGGNGIDGKQEDLHVAQSLFHDHVPAKKMGMASVWINRSGSAMGSTGTAELHEKGEVGYGWRFGTLGEFADEVEKQWSEKEGHIR